MNSAVRAAVIRFRHAVCRRLAILISAVALSSAGAFCWAQRENLPRPWSGPWTHGTVTAGYTYLLADQGAQKYINLNGWFAKPAFNLGNGWGAFASFTNYYGQNKKGPLNSHAFTFGAQKSLPGLKRLKPSAFAETGDLRVSNVAVTNSLLINAGAGLSVPVAKHFSLAFTPAEYVWIKRFGQPAKNDFNAKAGFSIPF